MALSETDIQRQKEIQQAEELLFSEDGIEYWLPVQSVLIPHFKRELSKGESLDLFAAWIGVTFAEPGKREHVFLVNEFEKADKNRVKRRGVL